MGQERTTLRAEPAAAREARQWVSGRLAAHVCKQDAVGKAVLLTSELASNVVRHTTASTMDLSLEIGDRVIRVAVSDPDPSEPALAEPSEQGSRGLRLVDSVAVRWGTDPSTPGKTVWFELPRSPQEVGAGTGRSNRAASSTPLTTASVTEPATSSASQSIPTVRSICEPDGIRHVR